MTVMDKLIVARPVDGTAARVIAKGFSHEVGMKPHEGWQSWDAPPPSKPRPAAAPDYTGHRRGMLVLFRYHAAGPSGSRWLARCDCGKYEVRNAGRWVKSDEPDACRQCRATHYVKTGRTLGDARPELERRAELRGAKRG